MLCDWLCALICLGNFGVSMDDGQLSPRMINQTTSVPAAFLLFLVMLIDALSATVLRFRRYKQHDMEEGNDHNSKER